MRLVEQLNLLHKSLSRSMRRQLAARTSLPFQQLRALKAIDRSGDRATQAALADKLLIDASAASRLVDRLVADGLVRRRSGSDRRSVQLELTASAARLVELVDEALDRAEAELVGRLGARRAAKLAVTLAGLAEALAKEDCRNRGSARDNKHRGAHP